MLWRGPALLGRPSRACVLEAGPSGACLGRRARASGCAGPRDARRGSLRRGGGVAGSGQVVHAVGVATAGADVRARGDGRVGDGRSGRGLRGICRRSRRSGWRRGGGKGRMLAHERGDRRAQARMLRRYLRRSYRHGITPSVSPPELSPWNNSVGISAETAERGRSGAAAAGGDST